MYYFVDGRLQTIEHRPFPHRKRLTFATITIPLTADKAMGFDVAPAYNPVFGARFVIAILMLFQLLEFCFC